MAIIKKETSIINIPKSMRRRMLHRVPVQVRRDKKHIYEPVVVSLGLYHHRRDPQLKLAEPFKEELRDLVCGDRKSSLLSDIHKRIDEIRHFYGGADGYDNKELGDMMLRDACFLICYMYGFHTDHTEANTTYLQLCERMGMSAMLFVPRDVFMLENQIPLWLISLIHPQHQSLLCEYLSNHVFGDHRMEELPWTEEEEEPLHLLEALYRTFQIHNPQPMEKPKSLKTSWQLMDSPFRSVTDLKAKGIHLRGSSYKLTDINFASFGLFAQLHLPIFFVTKESKVFFSNIIAFEMSPGIETDYGVTSYFNFMKTLINKADDVKVLREKGILYSKLASDEEVLNTFKSIYTYGYSNIDLFYEVNSRIDEHCKSKARRWMADLINTNFQSPWTVIALAAAMFLLCLTFLQTYFTIYPPS